MPVVSKQTISIWFEPELARNFASISETFDKLCHVAFSEGNILGREHVSSFHVKRMELKLKRRPRQNLVEFSGRVRLVSSNSIPAASAANSNDTGKGKKEGDAMRGDIEISRAPLPTLVTLTLQFSGESEDAVRGEVYDWAAAECRKLADRFQRECVVEKILIGAHRHLDGYHVTVHLKLPQTISFDGSDKELSG